MKDHTQVCLGFYHFISISPFLRHRDFRSASFYKMKKVSPLRSHCTNSRPLCPQKQPEKERGHGCERSSESPGTGSLFSQLLEVGGRLVQL